MATVGTFTQPEQSMHEDVKLANQLARMQNWKDPIVDSVTATILYKKRYPMVDDPDYGRHAILVTERLRGAAKGHHQAHHGGFIKPTDKNVPGAAAREVLEETGYIVKPEALTFVGKFGPELYRSTAEPYGLGNIKLTISSEQAEPGIPFVIDLYAAEIQHEAPRSRTDKEVRVVGWFTLHELLQIYGGSKTFNYWSFLIPALTILGGQPPRTFWDSSPGEQIIPLDMVST